MMSDRNHVKTGKRVERDLFDLAELFALMRDDEHMDTMKRALNLIKDHASADQVYVCMYDHGEHMAKIAYSAKTDEKDEGLGLKDLAMDDMRPIVEKHQQGHGFCLKATSSLDVSDRLSVLLKQKKVQGLITEPLIHEDRLYGCLVLEHINTPIPCNDKTIREIRPFTRILNAAIRRIRFHVTSDLKQLIDAVGVGTWKWDLETDHTIFNEKWAEMLGYHLEELQPINLDTWKNLTHPLDLQKSIEAIENVLAGNEPVYQAEFRMKHKQGHHVWVKDVGRIISHRDGNPKTMVGVHIDISEQKQKELYHRAITQAIDQSPVGIVITTVEGMIEYINPTFTSMTGYTRDEVIGNYPSILKSGYHDDAFYASIWETITNGREWKGELYNKRKDGTHYWESTSITPVYDDENVIRHFVNIKQDITRRKADEIEMRLYREQLESEIQTKITEVDRSHKASIIALAKLSESRDVDTGLHVERVQHLSKVLASSLRKNPKYSNRIDHDYLEDLFYAAALHDLGKVSIPDDILSKPGKLTDQEFEVIKLHVKTGADLLQEMLKHYEKNPIIKMGRQIALYHHERWNGSGYLQGLSGNHIPLEARIVGLVDVYDALRSKRPYKEPYPHERCYEMIVDESGKHFDPEIVDAFIRVSDLFSDIYDSFQ